MNAVRVQERQFQSDGSEGTYVLFQLDERRRDLENYILLPVNGSGFVILKQSVCLDEGDLGV